MHSTLPRTRNAASIFFTSTVRVLFTTLIFTAGAMGLGLLVGIIAMITYGLVAGVQPDMRHAYRHFAIPLAITIGSVAFVGALVLEVRARRTRGPLSDR
jgi:amino acid transporter